MSTTYSYQPCTNTFPTNPTYFLPSLGIGPTSPSVPPIQAYPVNLYPPTTSSVSPASPYGIPPAPYGIVPSLAPPSLPANNEINPPRKEEGLEYLKSCEKEKERLNGQIQELGKQIDALQKQMQSVPITLEKSQKRQEAELRNLQDNFERERKKLYEQIQNLNNQIANQRRQPPSVTFQQNILAIHAQQPQSHFSGVPPQSVEPAYTLPRSSGANLQEAQGSSQPTSAQLAAYIAAYITPDRDSQDKDIYQVSPSQIQNNGYYLQGAQGLPQSSWNSTQLAVYHPPHNNLEYQTITNQIESIRQQQARINTLEDIVDCLVEKYKLSQHLSVKSSVFCLNNEAIYKRSSLLSSPIPITYPTSTRSSTNDILSLFQLDTTQPLSEIKISAWERQSIKSNRAKIEEDCLLQLQKLREQILFQSNPHDLQSMYTKNQEFLIQQRERIKVLEELVQTIKNKFNMTFMFPIHMQDINQLRNNFLGLDFILP